MAPRFDRTATPEKTAEYMKAALSVADHANDVEDHLRTAVQAYIEADIRKAASEYRKAAMACYEQADGLANIASLFDNVQS